MTEIEELTRREKAEMFTGADNWHTVGVPEKNIRSVKMADGPSGLRIEKTTGFGFNESHEAVAYPTASALACSFDRDLLYELGEMLAEDCRKDGVDILLGPGVNHKRSPLCGRNFEYYSEDPILSGELASAYVNGLQSHGIGASLKHFAGNSREMGRLVSDSIIDERTLYEIYLRQFERVIRKAKPWTIMNAYNLLNGVYCTESSTLMDTARKKWGFDGVFISDWGAVSDPVQALKGGLNLQMPGGDHGTSDVLIKACEQEEELSHKLDESTRYLLDLEKKCQSLPIQEYSKEKHLQFARKAAAESAVLLKNENHRLPLSREKNILVIGAMARHPRFQGAGSSKVNSPADNILEALQEKGCTVRYCQGYHLAIEETDPILYEEALFHARQADQILFVGGLPEGKESEGYDRRDLDLPQCQNELLKALTNMRKDIAVVLQCGSPVVMPWAENVEGILLMYLSGCMGGHAAADLLLGDRNPSGKLAETFPLKLSDTPCYAWYHDDLYRSYYKETIFTGYRYYSSFAVPVLFPFGHGLSYTKFSYEDLCITETEGQYHLSLSVTNCGDMPGREVIQCYTGMKNSKIARPDKELKAFTSVELDSGETRQVDLTVEKKDLCYFDVRRHDWVIEAGEYTFFVGSSSEDIRLQDSLYVEGETDPCSTIKKEIYHRSNGILDISEEDYLHIIGKLSDTEHQVYPYHRNTTITDLEATLLGRLIHREIRRLIRKDTFKDVSGSMVFESPIRMMFMASSRITWDTLDQVIYTLNGHYFGMFRRIYKTLKKKRKLIRFRRSD